MNETRFSLFELNYKVKEVLSETFMTGVWVVAEIQQMQVARKGHCYLELIEKDDTSNKVIAKNRATIWSYVFHNLKAYFEQTTGYQLSEGLKVLLYVTVEFHEVFGLSLNVRDLDPTYTLGDIAKQRIETINRLKDDGVFDLNRELDFPIVPQKIAVVSSGTAAGYGDFVEQLNGNSHDYVFYTKLFEVQVQGDDAEESIIDALDRIYDYEDFFDVVVIIRGGGSKHDLSVFDNYDLACNIAQFPLPVVTGIGHERDESIADLVAAVHLKTPTAVAGFLVEKLAVFESLVETEGQTVIQKITNELSQRKSELNQLAKSLLPLVQQGNSERFKKLLRISERVKNTAIRCFENEDKRIKGFANDIQALLKGFLYENERNLMRLKELTFIKTEKYFRDKENFIQLAENKNKLLNPENIIKRGYAIVSQNNKIIKSVSDLHEKEEICINIVDGKIDAEIVRITGNS